MPNTSLQQLQPAELLCAIIVCCSHFFPSVVRIACCTHLHSTYLTAYGRIAQCRLLFFQALQRAAQRSTTPEHRSGYFTIVLIIHRDVCLASCWYAVEFPLRYFPFIFPLSSAYYAATLALVLVIG